MFSVLTSKVFGGLLIAVMVLFAIDEYSDNKEMKAAETTIAANKTTISDLRTNLATARSNTVTAEAGLRQCNAGVKALADQRDAMARAGTAAVQQVRRAGEQALEATNRRLSRMPTDGATAAEQCEQADAILLEGAVG